MPGRSREPAVPGSAPERLPLGVGLHLRGDLAGFRLRGVRHRRLCAMHRRLAGLPLGARRLRARCRRTGAIRAPPPAARRLIHHSDRGVQYVSIRYTERLVEADDRALGRQRRRPPTTPSPRRSTACSRPRSSIGAAPGEAWRPWSSPPLNGSTGSTTVVSSSRSATSRLPRRKPPTTLSLRQSRWPRRTQTNPPPANPAQFT